MKKILVAAAIASGFSTTAMAADSGAYVGAQLGSAKYGYSDTANRVTAGGVFAGYNFNPFFGIEAAYNTFGSEKSNLVPTTSISANAFAVRGVVNGHINENFAIYGRIGFANVSSSLKGLGGTISTSKTGLTAGVGAEYDFNPQMGLRFGFDTYKSEVKGATTIGANITDINGALVYKF